MVEMQYLISSSSSREIFRAYDIRGVVDVSLTADVVYQIGRALGSKIIAGGGDAVVIGRDGRLSGPDLIAQLSLGLRASGCDVLDIGMVPTPVLYFATKYLQVKSAVMLTGSHNPVNYNGLKIIINDQTIYGEQIQDLYRMIVDGDFAVGVGDYFLLDIKGEYIDAVKGNVQINRRADKSPLKLVIDCGNGVTGCIAPQLYQELGCEVIPLFSEVDGNFPNHHPDPGNPHNLQDLITAVRTHSADLGLAFDGDGDRLGIVDNNGKTIWPDRALMLFAEQVLAQHAGATIIYDVKCSRDLNNIIADAGGVPLMWNTGHSLIKAKMRETSAALAAEMSGHIFFKDRWYGFDDALYAGARLIEILSDTTQTAAQIFAKYPEQVSTPELNIAVPEDQKFKIMQDLIASAHFSDPHQRITIDGLRVEFAHGWGLLRPSNTTPNLVARFEAVDQEALDQIKNQFRQALFKVAPELQLGF